MQSSTQWAVNPGFDRVFLLASLAAPFLFYGIYVGLSPWVSQNMALSPELLFFALFTGLFDAPHIFQTFFRTHGIDERKRRPWFHNLALLMALGITLTCSVVGWTDVFIVFLGLFGGWHILRQNLGFLKVYQRREQTIPGDLHLKEQGFLYFTWFYFLFHESNSRSEWLADSWANLKVIAIADTLFTQVWFALFIYLLIKNFQSANWKNRIPKMLFYFGQCLTFFLLSRLDVPFLIMVALATISHTLQYQGWVGRWIRRDQKQGHWVRGAFLGTWILGLLLFLETVGDIDLMPGFWTLALIYNGFVLWHYFVDGFIWHFRSQPELSQLISK